MKNAKTNKSVMHLWVTPLVAILTASGSIRAQAPTALVIEGGTLIDGNGGTPVRDALIVIQGNKISTVSRKGQTSYPPNAQVVKADGKFIVPGLWDGHGYGTWFLNDLYLNNGVTTIVDNGLGGELSLVHREAVSRGKISGPRYITAMGSFSTDRTYSTGYEPVLFHNRIPKSTAEARELTKGFIGAGADFIFFQDSSLPVEILEAIVDEARKGGKPVVQESVGPTLTLEKGIELGISVMCHSPGVAKAIAKDASKSNNELELWADMDDAKAQALIRRMVDKKVALTPNILNSVPGYPKEWGRFQEETRKLFSDPNIRSFYPETTTIGRVRLTALGMLNAPGVTMPEGAVRERRRQGYLNLVRFHRMFADAGGKILTGGNTNVTKPAGLVIHHEMEALVEGGFSAMQTIQAATKWAAEAFHVQDRGTIEGGKLADLLIVGADPLLDIHNLQKIDSLIFNGNVVDRTYHPWPSDPFMDIGNISFGNPAVESLSWVATLKQATTQGGGEGAGGGGGRQAAVPDPPVSPQPAIGTISPTLVTEGSPTTTLVIKGFNFVRRMHVIFSGRSVPYQAVSPTELHVTLDETLLRAPGKFDIVVRNPPPIATPEWGDGTSNTAHLLVNFKY